MNIQLDNWPLFKITLYDCNNQETFYLLLSIPHIITDGYSYYLLIDAVNFCYNSLLSTNEIKRYAQNFYGQFLHGDFVAQNSIKGREFFLNNVEGIANLELNKIKQHRNYKYELEGNSFNFKIDKANIYNYIKDHKISESCFFISIYSLFLRKTIDEKLFVIGLPILNRKKPDKNIFGYFINVLPLVINFASITTFSELTAYVNKKIIALLRHQSFDISSLDSINTKINVLFTHYNREFNFNLNNCLFEKITLDKKTIMSEVRCTVETLDSYYNMYIECGNYLKETDVTMIMRTILFNVIKNEDCLLKEVQIYEESDLNNCYQNINLYNKHSNSDSIKSIFEDIVKKYPNKAALYDFANNWSYKKLNKTANKIARYLLEKTNQSNKIIISLERNNYLIAIILAILKIGKCYVPLDLTCPKDRFQHILNDLRTTTVIGRETIQNTYNIDNKQFIPVEELINSLNYYEDTNLNITVPCKNPAYIIYTSGSTGIPNGVEISNFNLLSLLSTCKKKFNFNHMDTWTLFHSYGFDFSVWEIFGCLLNGGKLIVVDALISKSPSHFYDVLSEHNVTILNQTPTAFKNIISEDLIKKHTLNIRYIIFGGEALHFPILKKWVDNHPLEKTKIINMYGITETTIHVTFYEVNYNDLENNYSVIGKPLNNLGIYIINSDGNIMPKGIQGEILVYGDGLSTGYYNNTILTDTRFITYHNSHLKYYKSGDLGRINKNYDIEYLGRMDKQIQLRGFRIELGEIENRILRSNLVENCAVAFINYTEEKDDYRIVAYVVTHKPSYDERVLKEKLKEFLPLYMMPSLFLHVDKIPTTINEKVDFGLLKQTIENKNKLINGKTSTEKYLFEIITKKIKNNSLSTKDNLLDAGVTSIDLIEILSKIKEKFLVKNISILDLFQYSSIEAIANYIDNKTHRLTKNA